MWVGGNLGIDPLGSHDYFEPRKEGRYYRRPSSFYKYIWISSDYRKRFALDANIGYYDSFDEKYSVWMGISPRLRLNDKAFIVYDWSYDLESGDVGFVQFLEDEQILFGYRDNKTISNSINGSYVFNNKSAVTLYLRHFWKQVDFRDFGLLQQNGRLFGYTWTENEDINFNVFSIDLTWSWNFAPGSYLTFLWKNYISPEPDQQIELKYFDNLSHTFRAYQSNSLSARVIYYFDYNYLKNRW
jgi:hypothetical protein